MMQRRDKSSAFTLFELILVMFIIALIAALAAPSLAGFGRGRVVCDTAAHFAALASFGRARAIADGQHYRITLDPAAGRFSLTHDDGSGQNFVACDDLDAQPFILSQDLHLETDAPEIDGLHVIEFQPEGRTDVATVHFTDKFGNAVDVACTSPLGFYRIASGPDVPGGRP